MELKSLCKAFFRDGGKKITGIFCVLMFLTGCFSASSSDSEEAFEYWSGAKPPKEIELIKGQYYQSPHFTLEYELFLKFKSTDDWWNEFVKSNGLQADRQNDEWKMFVELPQWFKPDNNFLIYSRNDKFDRSRYFFNPKERMCYAYETKGM